MAKKRIDQCMVECGLADSLSQAHALLLAGRVLVDRQRIDKPGTLIESHRRLELKDKAARYVSRGGEKLEGALRSLGIDVKGCTCLDLGASTGGFTDCLLRNGALKVYAFDVGRGQLHWRLQTDSRVVVRDQFNVRYLDRAAVDGPVDWIVADLCHISLTLILPALKPFGEASVLVLVKPQFEGRRDEVDSGGIVRDEGVRQRIVGRVEEFACQSGFQVLGQADSPLRGRRGNLETFLWLRIQE